MLVYEFFADVSDEVKHETYAQTLWVSLPNTSDVETYFGEVYRRENSGPVRANSSFYQFTGGGSTNKKALGGPMTGIGSR